MAPGANLDHFALYQQGASVTRPERSFDPADVMENALAELAALVDSGQRAHRCDPRFALEVTRALAAAEAALQLPGTDLPAATPHPLRRPHQGPDLARAVRPGPNGTNKCPWALSAGAPYGGYSL